MIAHPNQATKAIIERMMVLYPKMFGGKVSDILWYKTHDSHKRRVESEKYTSPEMNALCIHERRLAYAGARPISFPTFLTYPDGTAEDNE